MKLLLEEKYNDLISKASELGCFSGEGLCLNLYNADFSAHYEISIMINNFLNINKSNISECFSLLIKKYGLPSSNGNICFGYDLEFQELIEKHGIHNTIFSIFSYLKRNTQYVELLSFDEFEINTRNYNFSFSDNLSDIESKERLKDFKLSFLIRDDMLALFEESDKFYYCYSNINKAELEKFISSYCTLFNYINMMKEAVK